MSDRHEKISLLLLWIYLWILFWLQSVAVNIYVTVFFALFLGALAFLLSFLIVFVFSDKIAQIKMDAENQHGYYIWGVVTLITFLVFEMYLAGQYPGGLSGDTVWQLSQAKGEAPYSDWHPVLHTFLFFTLPLKSGFQFGFIVFMQLLYFSLAFGYLVYTLYINKCPKLFVFSICIYTWINPFMATYMMYAWKDVAMAVFAVLLMGYYIQIICTKGKWLSEKKNMVLFAAAVIGCNFMRHNAILFLAPLVFIVLFYALKGHERKIKTALIGCMLLFFLLVKVFYAILDVESPDKRVLETVGFPLTVWCNVMQKNPDALPKETEEFMYELADKEAYENDYRAGSFNDIKWKGTIDNAKIDSLSYGTVLKYTFQCFRYAPRESFEAVAKLTDMVWSLIGDEYPADVGVEKNPWEIGERPVPQINLFVGQLKLFLRSGFGRILFGSYGFELLMMLGISAAMYAKRRSCFIHVLPLFCYDFGTMLLLSGDDYRFFLLNIPLWLPVIFIMLRDEGKLTC